MGQHGTDSLMAWLATGIIGTAWLVRGMEHACMRRTFRACASATRMFSACESACYSRWVGQGSRAEAVRQECEGGSSSRDTGAPAEGARAALHRRQQPKRVAGKCKQPAGRRSARQP